VNAISRYAAEKCQFRSRQITPPLKLSIEFSTEVFAEVQARSWLKVNLAVSPGWSRNQQK
jgi:hypothetical protein